MKEFAGKQSFELSRPQKRMWLVSQSKESSVAYNITGVYTIEGSIDIERFEAAVQSVVERHDSLRAGFYLDDSGPRQLIRPLADCIIDYNFISLTDVEPQQELISSVIGDVNLKPFNLEQAPLLRLRLLQTDTGKYLFVVVMHHTVSDGYSFGVFIKDLFAFYKGEHLPALRFSYRECILQHNKVLASERTRQKQDFWLSYFRDRPELLNLPYDYKRPPVQTFEGDRIFFQLSPEQSSLIRTFITSEKTSLFVFLLSVYNLFLHKVSQQDDVVIGVPFAGRNADVNDQIGMFVNTVAVRTKSSGEQTFRKYLGAFTRSVVEVYRNQNYPFEELYEQLRIKRDLSRNPLFDVMFVLHENLRSFDFNGYKANYYEFKKKTCQYDLILDADVNETQISFHLQYNTGLFMADTAGRFSRYIKNIISNVLSDPETVLSELEYLDESDREILSAFNDTAYPYKHTDSIVQMFERQVEKTPESTALIHENEELSYRELNKRANRLAHYMLNSGVKPGSLIPLCIDRSFDMVIAVLAILKTGGAYVPVDPEYPEERIAYMLQDTAASYVLATSETLYKLKDHTALRLIVTDKEDDLIRKQAEENPVTYAGADQLIFLLYTSGSTGRPKGVRMPDSALRNLLIWQEDEFEQKQDRMVLQFASLNFDASFQELFSTLCFGSTIVLIDKDKRKDMAVLARAIEHFGLTHLFIPYVVLKNLAQHMRQESFYPQSLNEVVTAGEQLKLTEDLRLMFMHCKARLSNHYGPTEAHVVTRYIVRDSDYLERPLPPIGRPIYNTTIHILSEDKRILPVGSVGELYIGGVQVACGYLNLPELTGERFIPDLFSNIPGARLYKTGDLARWLPDGNIEFLGRMDDQVKIRGYRIEPGEVESVLQQCGLVKQAVIVVREDKEGNKYLVAYIVPEGNFDKEGILDYSRSRLPDYMIPGMLVEMDVLPITTNGKVNKRALPDPGELLSLRYAAARTEPETRLAAIWQELLNAERVGIHDDFFSLGGHSLVAIRLLAAIRKEFKVELSIADIFKHPTVETLANHLDGRLDILPTPLQAGKERPAVIPLSFGQERLWFIDQLEGSVQYHIPLVLRIHGTIRAELLEEALKVVVNRHEVLRTVIRQTEGTAFQQILDGRQWKMDKISAPGERGAGLLTGELISKPFNLTEDYMLRACLMLTSSEYDILVLTVHHIAADGWSMPVLLRELAVAYSSLSERQVIRLEPLTLQYADYSLWQRQYLQGAVLSAKLKYWKEKLEAVPALNLPADFSRPAVRNIEGASLRLSLDKELTDALKILSRQEGVTLYMTLLAAFKVLLYRYSGQEDFCVGSPIANRQHEETEQLIGFFINMLALRSDLSGKPSFSDLLQRVKNTTLAAYEHQDTPFEKIVEAVVKERDMSRSPLFQVMFVMQNIEGLNNAVMPGMEQAADLIPENTSQFDMTFVAEEKEGELKLYVEYSTALFREETVKRMMKHYRQLLRAAVAAPSEGISEMAMLSTAEMDQLLGGVNDTVSYYPEDKTVISLFEEQVLKTPGAIALSYEGLIITYSGLNEQANQLAHYLSDKGLQRESLVPICLGRGPQMIIAMLGVLKAGGAYVPLDPDLPQERILFILEDTAAAFILTTSEYVPRIPEIPACTIIDITAEEREISRKPAYNPLPPDAGSLIYVIYTSGSTGRPKGVLTVHRAVLNLICSQTETFGISAQERILQFSSFSFDASVEQIYLALSNGACLVLLPGDLLFDAGRFKAFIKKEEITHLHTTPGFLETIDVEELPALKRVIAGGDVCSKELAHKWGGKYAFYNEYGPTETTVTTSEYRAERTALPDYASLPVGKALKNTRFYVLGKSGELVPQGVAGELYIGGAQVARGYLNLPELTAERFVEDRFSKLPGARLYRTGDLVRWLPDGNLEYIGRTDEQVKLRGYRIELAEIENVLLESGLLKQAAVVLRGANGNRHLAAFVIPTGTFSGDELRSFAQRKLPEYMVPAFITELQSLPLTSNGKIDKRALINLVREPESDYAAPQTRSEKDLVKIWQDITGADRIGLDDNFFELGGDSIMTIRIVSRARNLGYSIQPRDIFLHQTIRSLARDLMGKENVSSLSEQGRLSGLSGLLPIQQNYFERNNHESISHYNQSTLLAIPKDISADDITQALKILAEQHDALRFSYSFREGEWKQQYGTFEPVLDTAGPGQVTAAELPAHITSLTAGFQERLNIFRGEVVRALFIITPEYEANNRLLLVIHHLVVDAVSWHIILEDLDNILDALKNNQTVLINSKTSSYRQWHNTLLEYSNSPKLYLQKDYWKSVSEGYAVFPSDYNSEGTVKAGDMITYVTSLDPDYTRDLIHQVPRAYHTEINDILLSALAKIIQNWSNAGTICLHLEGHGREHISEYIDTTRTVGWFTTLFPLLIKLGRDEEEPGNLIRSVKEQLRRIPDKGLGYGLLKYIRKEEELQKPVPVNLVFNYLGQESLNDKTKCLIRCNEDIENEISKGFIFAERQSLNCFIRDEKLVINWTYSGRHYKPETIERLAGQYVKQLGALVDHCKEQLKAGTVFTPSDYDLPEISYQELDTFMADAQETGSAAEKISSIYRLSGLQEGILFHSLYDDKAGAYVGQFEYELSHVNEQAFVQSWRAIVGRSTIFRTGFHHKNLSLPIQCVYRQVKLPLIIEDFRHYNEEEQKTALGKLKAEDRQAGFNLGSPPLMRITLIRLSETEYRMLWTHHHLLLDGWSMELVLQELMNNYKILNSGRSLGAQVEDKFQDYIRYAGRKDKRLEEIYWKQYLEGATISLLPFVKAGNERNKGLGLYKRVLLELDQDTSAAITEYAQKNHFTINTIMQAVWAYLLYRYTGNSGPIFGVTVSGRPDDLPDIEDRVGMYINTLPLKTGISPPQPVKDWLAGIQEDQLKSRDYQYSSLSYIQEWSGLKGELFDSLMMFANFPVRKSTDRSAAALEMKEMEALAHTNYPFNIIIAGTRQIDVCFSYNSDLLNEAWVSTIKDHFEYVLLQICDPATEKLADIKMLHPLGRRQVLEEFNGDAAAHSETRSVLALFEEHAFNNPDSVALIFEKQKISYRELNERSNKLGHFLLNTGVKEESLVPVCLPRGPEMIIAILGILKAGAAYVPIDPDYPEARIKYILDDTAAKILVSAAAERANLPERADYRVVDIQGDRSRIEIMSGENPAVSGSMNSLAYVIYTSGSTGRPKGVMIEHASLSNYIQTRKKIFGTDSSERILQFSNYCFDASAEQIFLALTSGAGLVLLNKQLLLDTEGLEVYMLENGVTHLHATPGFLENINPANCGGLKRVISGGDNCPGSLARKWASQVEFYNKYGPTEATISVSEYLYKPESSGYADVLPIGKPLAGTRVYILNEDLELLPAGLAGELYIGGIQVARGYLNEPALNLEKFVNDPFSSIAGGRLYRTGDLARWFPDGNIEFLGRQDEQVKIRGYRIEPAEVEAVLQQCELVKQAVVLIKEDALGDKFMAAYIVPQDSFNKDAILEYAGKKLPDYMLPSTLVQLEHIPLTSNGKIDKAALSALEEVPAGQFIEARTPLEKKLAGMWQQLLGLERVGLRDNFFELGGHSLMAIRLLLAIRKELKVELSIADVFNYLTIEALAAHLSRQSASVSLPLLAYLERPARIPLSFGQQQLWFIDQMEGSVQYHVPLVLRIDRTLSQELLEKALQTLVNRHEILRTVIRQHEGTAFQQVLEAGRWKLDTVEIMEEQKTETLISGLISMPFNLSEDHMLRACFIVTAGDFDILVITMHHIAADGWSMAVLLGEFAEISGALSERRPFRLEPLPVQYSDYSIWQRQYLRAEVLAAKLNYWEEKLKAVSVLNLPADFVRPAIRSTSGASLRIRMDKELLAGLKTLSQQEGVTLFMTLLAAFKVLLYRYSGQEDICVGSPIANRQNQETEGLIGFFINMLALRSDLSGNPEFTGLLRQVRNTTLGAYEHQDTPFEKVVEVVLKERDASRSPLFQVMFVMQNIAAMDNQIMPGVEQMPEIIPRFTSKFDLTFLVEEMPEGLDLYAEYCTDLFREDTISRLMACYEQLLRSVVADPSQGIAEIKILSRRDEVLLLEKFATSKVSYPQDKTIIQLVEEQAYKTPDAIALVFDKQRFSYRMLNERSNQLAYFLRSKGVEKESLVPVCAGRSAEMIIGILGILKAGGTYVPLDPDYPEERIKYVIQDIKASLILTTSEYREEFPALAACEVIELDHCLPEISNLPVDNLEAINGSDSLVYIIYTSGSTGKPKGVMIEHRSLTDHLYGLIRETKLEHCRSFALFASLSADAGHSILFSSLITGGELHLISDSLLSDAITLSEYVKDIDCIKIVPSLWSSYYDISREKGKMPVPRKMIIFGGEALPPKVINRLAGFSNRLDVYNHYGPTEATIGKTICKIDLQKEYSNVPIGKPFSNTGIYLLTPYMQLSIPGGSGEIHIAGAGIARAYLNLPDVTKERFVNDIFNTPGGSGRMYKTGDLGRWLPDGNIEYLGRIDGQVKINGHRIELLEIEDIITGYPSVKECLVIVKDAGESIKKLVAYFTAEESVSTLRLRKLLSSKLPAYCIPSSFVQLDEMPLTVSGKADRKSLEDLSVSGMGEARMTGPRSELEMKVAAIWKEVLSVDTISVYDDFFSLGGSSILVIKVIALLKSRVGAELKIRDFINQNLADIAAKCQKQLQLN